MILGVLLGANRINLQKNFPNISFLKKTVKSNISTILHFTHSKAIDVVYVVQNPWRGFERSAVREWPRHLVQDDLVEDHDRMPKPGSSDGLFSYFPLHVNFREHSGLLFPNLKKAFLL